MAASWYLRIDGVVTPTPVECDVTEIDLDSDESGRGETGFMNRDRIRSGVMSLDISWEHLTAAEARTLRNAVFPAAFSVEILFLGETILRTMYAGDRHFQEHIRQDGSSDVAAQIQLTEI